MLLYRAGGFNILAQGHQPHLTGFSYAPRFKNLKRQRLYIFRSWQSVDRSPWKIKPAAYCDEQHIIQFWDDILRFIATIKLKETTAPDIFGVWQRFATKWAIWATRVQFSITGSEFLIARRRCWFITWRFCIKRECGLTFTNRTQHPLVRAAGHHPKRLIGLQKRARSRLPVPYRSVMRSASFPSFNQFPLAPSLPLEVRGVYAGPSLDVRVEERPTSTTTVRCRRSSPSIRHRRSTSSNYPSPCRCLGR
jgi:Tn3 transposase DDE domain